MQLSTQPRSNMNSAGYSGARTPAQRKLDLERQRVEEDQNRAYEDAGVVPGMGEGQRRLTDLGIQTDIETARQWGADPNDPVAMREFARKNPRRYGLMVKALRNRDAITGANRRAEDVALASRPGEVPGDGWGENITPENDPTTTRTMQDVTAPLGGTSAAPVPAPSGDSLPPPDRGPGITQGMKVLAEKLRPQSKPVSTVDGTGYIEDSTGKRTYLIGDQITDESGFRPGPVQGGGPPNQAEADAFRGRTAPAPQMGPPAPAPAPQTGAPDLQSILADPDIDPADKETYAKHDQQLADLDRREAALAQEARLVPDAKTLATVERQYRMLSRNPAAGASAYKLRQILDRAAKVRTEAQDIANDRAFSEAMKRVSLDKMAKARQEKADAKAKTEADKARTEEMKQEGERIRILQSNMKEIKAKASRAALEEAGLPRWPSPGEVELDPNIKAKMDAARAAERRILGSDPTYQAYSRQLREAGVKRDRRLGLGATPEPSFDDSPAPGPTPSPGFGKPDLTNATPVGRSAAGTVYQLPNGQKVVYKP